MSKNYTLNFKRVLLSVFVFTLFVSCSASNHAGITYVKEPPENTSDEQTWFSYYQDQFDAFEGNVLSPPENYPKVARQAYQRASLEWEEKLSSASNKTMLAYIAAGILIPIAITLALTP